MQQQFNVPFFFGGTAILIVVGVALDTMSQLESHLIMRHYEGFSKTLQFRGATIIELSFAKSMFKALKTAMKKKAGNLNLNLSIKDCF